ncbi:hypothetical protein [Methylobacter sp. S3L5C]|uniref:TRAFAC clade GTPase domain-containing protein n=1 Tax=Methylobacter sp. S3L5C TaxID=2839024 RepID=UPI001FAB7BCE|nr:hypothetical protein [Methylobacter sp. S3L5C]UOA07353.1 hypothetical protein KKZ03_13825 [Methylobacter sp. S3L5C]
MSTVNTDFRCKRDGCTPEESGDCIDGLPLSDCPNRYVFEPVDEEFVNIDSSLVKSFEADGIRHHNGEALNTTEADIHLRKHGATVVAFIGYPGAGKTTTAVMLYELSKRRNLEPFGFAGSYTIRGFQERAHMALLTSGRRIPDTARTTLGTPVSFLHLRLQKTGGDNESIELLLSDRSGEDFEQCLNKPALCETFPEIIRANCHVLLIDGEKLVNSDVASKHISDIKRLVLALNQYGLLSASGLVQVVLTKYDLVNQSEHREKALQRFNLIIEEIKKRLYGTVRITEYKLAARPLCSQFNLGDGLVNLINDWFPTKQEAEYHLVIPTLTTGTPYDLLINTVRE